MKKIIITLMFILFSFSYSELKSEFNIIESKNTLSSHNLLLDINSSTEGEMLKNGISKSYVDKIVEYRVITGGFKKISDMKRIAGIGAKTYDKLKIKFKEPGAINQKKFNINKAEDKVLTYYGFSKKEIQKIRKNQENGIFRNNLDLKSVISEKKYEELKNYIEY
ncbi:MAG: helix-hairpin-helix domain-containing protein [Cetobacterium sp.]